MSETNDQATAVAKFLANYPGAGLMSLDEFVESGFLLAVNAEVLHPHGLAMSVDRSTGEVAIIDDRDDPDGWTMTVDDDIRQKEARLEEAWRARRAGRKAFMNAASNSELDWAQGSPSVGIPLAWLDTACQVTREGDDQ